MDNYLILRQNCLEIAPLKHNGPAIKFSRCPRVLGVAHFLLPDSYRDGYKLSGVYECRGTSHYKSVLGAGTNCKNRDEPINFIDRVIMRCVS